mmetsp:Transcript_11858/g.25005  ORF Transcript_11858/g.25005 Transcript_11858/m.25005 type:complete len:84 (-) Transcript_11858:1445-1696(-)
MHCKHTIAMNQNNSSDSMLIRIETPASFIAANTNGGNHVRTWPLKRYRPMSSASCPLGIIVHVKYLSIVYFQPPQAPQKMAKT